MALAEWDACCDRTGPAPRWRARWRPNQGTKLALVSLLATACASAASTAPAASARGSWGSPLPKYAVSSVPLSRDHTYFQRAAAPDFWALAPYYVGQQTDAGCSLATLTMLVNAARHATPLTSDQPLVTQTLLLERVRSESWRRGVSPDGDGVSLPQLAELARQSLAAFGLTPTRLETTHVGRASAEALERLRSALRRNEASAGDYLLLNFDVRAFVGVGDYGHIAPVAAYDAERQRVLVLDPDRTWYEPYWIPDVVALAGMATRDSVTAEPRGYVYVGLQ